jgi:hypothetical protein
LGRKALDEVEELVLQMAQENRTWRYKRFLCETAANILKRHGLAPAQKRGKRMLGV